MIDPARIRAEPDRLKEIVRLRKVNPAKADVDRWLALDERRRALQTEIDNAQRREEAGRGPRQEGPGRRARARPGAARAVTRELETELDAVTAEWNAIMEWFPNWIDPEMPHGARRGRQRRGARLDPGRGLSAGVEARHVATTRPSTCRSAPSTPTGELRRRCTTAELGERLGGVDTLQARQGVGLALRLPHRRHRADADGDPAPAHGRADPARLSADHPAAAGARALAFGTSHFPEGRDQVYEIKTDNVEEPLPLFLVGSSEPANFSYFMDRTLDEAELPVQRLRRHALLPLRGRLLGQGHQGHQARAPVRQDRDERRVHRGAVGRRSTTSSARSTSGCCSNSQLPYRIVDKCTGDAGYLATYRQRDVEVWLSGSGEYMEVMTDTNTTDYQARRLNIRYRDAEGGSRFATR